MGDLPGETQEPEYDDELIEFDIPNWAISPLINGDESGLNDEEQERLDAFVQDVMSKYGNANFMLADENELDLGFLRSNDIDNLGGEASKLLIRPSSGMNEVDKVDLSKMNNPNAYTDDIINHNADKDQEQWDKDSGFDDGNDFMRISIPIMSALSDIQESNPELRNKINFIKALIQKSKIDDQYIDDSELNDLEKKFNTHSY
jgi:hypothetical protein